MKTEIENMLNCISPKTAIFLGLIISIVFDIGLAIGIIFGIH